MLVAGWRWNLIVLVRLKWSDGMVCKLGTMLEGLWWKSVVRTVVWWNDFK